jgi:putative transposase
MDLHNMRLCATISARNDFARQIGMSMSDSAYATDLTDEQWAIIEPLIPPAKPGGRPRTTDVRRVFDACLYVVKTGCQWRSLPRGFPPWRTVYGYFVEWGSANNGGIFRRLHRRCFFQARKQAGRSKYPSVVIIDSQSVKTGKMGGVRGYDGGKHVKGRKRHTAVDTLGLPMAITVTAANVHDLKGGKKSLTRVSKFIGGRALKKIHADGAYAAEAFRDWVRERFDAIVRISKNLAQKFKEFVPVSQRWVVERSFSWWHDYRRLTMDYERLLKTSRNMLRLAAIRLMLNRLAPPPDRPLWTSWA